MTGLAVTIRKNSRAFQKLDYGLENALAKYVRNRWADKTIQYVAHEWDLSESEAAKVVYATASKNTLNKLLWHKRGGFGLYLELICDATDTKLEQYIARQAKDAANERAKWEARERHLANLEARLADRDSLGGQANQPSWPDGSDDARVGAEGEGAPVERPNFAEPATRTDAFAPHGLRRRP